MFQVMLELCGHNIIILNTTLILRLKKHHMDHFISSIAYTGYWILDASQTDPPSDLPNRQFGKRA